MINQKNFFPKSRRGLSAVVTTLIIILLVLVAIGIVWVVVRNIVEEGSGEMDTRVKCIDIDVRASIVNCTVPSACDITLIRGSGGDTIGGVKLVFYEGTIGGNIIDSDGDIAVLSTKQVSAVDSGLTTPDKVQVTVYFTDESGNDQLCPQPTSFSF